MFTRVICVGAHEDVLVLQALDLDERVLRPRGAVAELALEVAPEREQLVRVDERGRVVRAHRERPHLVARERLDARGQQRAFHLGGGEDVLHGHEEAEARVEPELVVPVAAARVHAELREQHRAVHAARELVHAHRLALREHHLRRLASASARNMPLCPLPIAMHESTAH